MPARSFATHRQRAAPPARCGHCRETDPIKVVEMAGAENQALHAVCDSWCMASIQTLSDTQRRILARWALACAERVVPLYDGDEAGRRVIQEAVARTRAYGEGKADTADQIRKRFAAGKAAKSAATASGASAARSVAQAASVAHMGAHALGAAAYAVKAVDLACEDEPKASAAEIRWQVQQLGDRQRMALRELPLLGTDSSGPLGPGLLCTGILGATIRAIQAELG